MQVTQGSLVLLNLNTPQPEIYWNGVLVPGVDRIRVDWDSDDYDVKLFVSGAEHELYSSMAAGGIIIKRTVK